MIEPGGKATAYTFDSVGNWTTETIAIATTTSANSYEYDEQNRLTGTTTSIIGTVTDTTVYTYDNNGNMLTTTVNGTVAVTNTYNR